MIQVASKIWKSYLTVLNKYPLRVQVIQTGSIMTLGDVFAQKVVERKKEIDVKRMLRFTVLGSFIVGPMVRTWLLTLERLFGPTVTLKRTFQKLFLDQFAFAPFSQTTILTSIGIMQGLTSIELVKAKVQNELPHIYFTGLKIWPLVNLINFYYVPFQLRPLVISTVALFWYTFLAWSSNGSENSETKQV